MRGGRAIAKTPGECAQREVRRLRVRIQGGSRRCSLSGSIGVSSRSSAAPRHSSTVIAQERIAFALERDAQLLRGIGLVLEPQQRWPRCRVRSSGSDESAASARR